MSAEAVAVKLLGGGSGARSRIPYLASTPLDGFTPGWHEVRVKVEHNGLSDPQALFVTIE